jgi:hypothetical protein
MDLNSLLYSDEPTAQEQMQAQAAALRKKQDFGALGVFSGDPSMSSLGQADMQNAQHQQDQLNQIPQQRLKLALEKQNLASGGIDLQAKQREADQMADPNSQASQILLGQAGRFGIKTPAGTPGNAVPQPVLAMAMKAQEAEESRKERLQAAMLMANSRAGYAPGGGGSPMGLSSEAIDQAAKMYLTTGQLPPMGMGVAGARLKSLIANRAAEMSKDADLASNKANYSANRHSLESSQKQADQIDAFEGTALKNLDLAVSSARKIVDTGSPLFNAPFRKVQQNLSGSPEMAAFTAARQAAISEVSKVLSGSMGNGSVSDSARHEASALMSPDASMAQIESAVSILKQDMANRKASTHGQIDTIRGRISGTPQPAEAQAQGGDTAAGEMIDVISPEGRRGKIPTDKLDAAMKRGFKRVSP